MAEGRKAATPWPEFGLLVCTARLNQTCRFDLLLHAMALLDAQGHKTSLNLIGDGPERTRLEKLASDLSVRVQFHGACYDESALARYIYFADATVSPGKVGLAAIHSLTYGTPVITHSNLDSQMPEVEAIVEDVTGAFFKENSVEDLARAIHRVLSDQRNRDLVREECRKVIETRYNPDIQARFIEQVLKERLP